MVIPKIFPVTSHTDHVGQGSTFVAIQGFKTNGTQFVPDAIKLGAATIVIEQAMHTPELEQLCTTHHVKLDVVVNARQELATRAAHACENPAIKLKLIGITGTKGKTTTSYLVEHILHHAGLSTGLVGSIKNRITARSTKAADYTVQEASATHATPGSDELQMFLAQCVGEKVSHAIIETSAHALNLHRVYGIEFDAVGFTNLHHDHMDFYASMDHYFADKIKLFSQVKAGGSIVINTDNVWGIKAFNHAVQLPNITVITFGQKSLATHANNHRHVQFSVLDSMSLSVALEPDTPSVSRKAITCPVLIGEFNGYNLVMAWLICFKMGISPETIQNALNLFSGVPGRMQLHRLQNGALGIVDYAHNAISTESVLKFLRSLTKHLIVICGSGGDRDPSRRPQISALAAHYADQIILTIGSPRSEDPIKIINDFFIGIPHSQRSVVIQEPNRLQAIEHAVRLSQPDSIIALLGQGHESYYVVGNKSLFFNDYEEIKKF